MLHDSGGEQVAAEKAGNVGYPGNLGVAGLPAFLCLFFVCFVWSHPVALAGLKLTVGQVASASKV